MSEGQAKLPNGEITSNVYDAFDKGYAQAKIDLAEQAVEQEPVAWLITHHENQPVLTFNSSDWASERFVKTPLYAQPPKRQPLSDDEIKNMWLMSAIFGTNLEKAVALTKAIEKAHGISNER